MRWASGLKIKFQVGFSLAVPLREKFSSTNFMLKERRVFVKSICLSYNTVEVLIFLGISMDFVVDDVFAQIIRGEAPAAIVYEDEHTMAFKDINPKANFHALIVPKLDGLVTGLDVHEQNRDVFGRLFLVAKYVSDLEDLDTYKLHMNVGTSAGQVVPRVHLHQLSSDYAPNLRCSALTDVVFYEDDDAIAFQHEHPECEHHIVIQLKNPEFESGLDVRENNLEEYGNLFWVAKSVSQQLGLDGYKLFMNVAPAQSTSHLACFHMLSDDYKTKL